MVSLWPRCKSCPTTTIMMVTLCLGVGRRGRPEIEISMEMITALVKEGYSARRIADMMGCSTSFVYNKLYRAGLKMRDRYSCDTTIDELKAYHAIRLLMTTKDRLVMAMYL